ncbi:MAG: hypothetical protein D3906_05550 [Candidatus Electrothrix sp. AUS1_2]|nr:hypothetical protein [Candidatus Electrothrix sp. AUS1_2]
MLIPPEGGNTTKEVVLPKRKGTEKEGDIQKKLSHIFSCAMLKLIERVSVVFRKRMQGNV